MAVLADGKEIINAFEGDVIAEDAAFADDGMGVGKQVVACLDTGVEDDMGQEGGVRADPNSCPNNDIGPNMSAFSDLRRGVNNRSWMHPRGVGGRLVEESQGAREGQVGILDSKRRGCDLREFGLNQNGGGLRGAGKGGVAGVGNEGDFGRSGNLNPFHARHFHACVAVEGCAQPRCQFA